MTRTVLFIPANGRSEAQDQVWPVCDLLYLGASQPTARPWAGQQSHPAENLFRMRRRREPQQKDHHPLLLVQLLWDFDPERAGLYPVN